MDQLIRETQPPAGTLRSPVPQYWNPDTEKYERVLGVHGAPRAMLYGPNGQPISTSNRLPVDVGAQVATESTLAEAVSRLNAILTRLEGTLDVDVGGQIHADVDLGDVTVQIGEVQQGKRGQNAEPWEVTLTGQIPSGSNTIGRVAIDRDESSPVVTHPRQILTSSVFNLIPVPAGAVGVKVETVIHGVSGTFGDGQGVRTDAWGYGRRLSSSVIEVSTQRTRESGRSHFIWWYPGIDEERERKFNIRSGNALRIVNSVLPPRMNFRIDITGTFEDEQGVDCEQFIEWLF